MSFKLAVFTGSPLSHLLASTVLHVLDRFADAEILILSASPRRSAKKLVRSQMRNLRIHGWRWIPYQGRNIARSIAERRAPAARMLETDRPVMSQRLAAVFDDPRVRLIRGSNLASPEILAEIEAFAPDLGLSLGGPILKPATFELPRLGSINLHQGRLPDYRGMPPAFWELWNGECEVHASVHRVEKSLDTGAVLKSASVPVEKFATPAGVRVRLDAISPELVSDAIADIRAGVAKALPQSGEGRTNRRPTLAQEQALRVRLAGRQGILQQTKQITLAGYATLSGMQRAKRDCVAILLYHRVCDVYRDSVSCGVETFDTQMAYLSDHHRVVPLSRLLEGALPAGDGPIIAITFDDGYLDNYEQAAPILIKHGLPATFFVSTRICDESLIFPHDKIALGHKVPTMSWTQMRQMQDVGLTFGGHTANHVNMAEVTDDVAAHELATSRDMLREKLGLAQPMFAYPYGKRTDFTPARLEQVKSAGYVANCSAYGGVNPLAVDRWNIRRFGVDERFTLPALRSRIFGWDA